MKENDIGNVFDKIFKENAAAIFIPLVESYLGGKIIHSKQLPIKIQTTTEREMDFLFDISLDSGSTFLLDLEFQTDVTQDMVYRIGEYHGLF